MKSVISADSRHHNRFRRYALRSMPQPVRRVWDLDRIGIGITRTPAMLADPIDDAPSVIPRLNVGQRKGNREAWPASPGPGAPFWSCCPARWEPPAGATAGSRREHPSFFRASRDQCEPPGFRCQQPDVSRLDRHLAHRRDPRYGHGAELTGLQSAQPCVYGGLGEARQRLKPEPLDGVRRAPGCPPVM